MSPIKLLLPVLMLLCLAGMGCASEASQAERLTHYLQENQATQEEKDAYRFALAHPEALRKIPCFCGCVALKHGSNFNCFFKEAPKGKKATANEFDDHGLICPMCVQIALRTRDELAEGKSLKDIRAKIDAEYGKFPQLHTTHTAKP